MLLKITLYLVSHPYSDIELLSFKEKNSTFIIKRLLLMTIFSKHILIFSYTEFIM